MLDRKPCDQLTMAGGDDVRQGDQPSVRLAGEGANGLLDSGRVAYAGHRDRHAERRPSRLGGAEHRNIGCRFIMHEHGRAGYAGGDLFEYFHPLATHRRLEIGEACGHAAWPRQALDETAANRIGDLHEHSRDGAVFLTQCREAWIAVGEHDVGRQREQFLSVCAQAFNVRAGEAVIDADVAAVGPAEVRETLPKRRDAGAHVRIIFGKGQQHADPTNPVALLRTRRQRPRRRCTAEKRDELAPPHVLPSVRGSDPTTL